MIDLSNRRDSCHAHVSPAKIGKIGSAPVVSPECKHGVLIWNTRNHGFERNVSGGGLFHRGSATTKGLNGTCPPIVASSQVFYGSLSGCLKRPPENGGVSLWLPVGALSIMVGGLNGGCAT